MTDEDGGRGRGTKLCEIVRLPRQMALPTVV